MPSAGAALPTRTLSDAEKADIRRFTGYPVIGVDESTQSLWFMNPQYRQNEWRMNNLRPEELQQVRQYLSQLYPLETAIVGSSENLDTDRAAVWYHNKNEVQDRMGLYNRWRRQLCRFLGLPPGPGLGQGGITFTV